MGLTFRNIKGSALTIDELDNNFSYFTGSQSITGSLVVTGDEDVNGNLIVSGNITGTSSLAITASHALQADNATTASYALNTPLAPTQTSVTASGTDITTTVVLEYGKVNLVYCDNSDYAVRLPEPILGGEVKVVNQGTKDLLIFPFDSNDSIVGLNTGSAYILSSGSLMYTFECVQNPTVGNWSVISPYNGVSTKQTVTFPTLRVNQSSGGGSGVKITGSTDFVASLDNQLTSGSGASLTGLYAQYLLDSSATGSFIVDFSPFQNFSEIKIEEIRIKTNIPAMSPAGRSGASFVPWFANEAMDISTSEYATIGMGFRERWWNFDQFYTTPIDYTNMLETAAGGVQNGDNFYGANLSHSIHYGNYRDTSYNTYGIGTFPYTALPTDPQNTNFTGSGYISGVNQMMKLQNFSAFYNNSGSGWIPLWDSYGNQAYYLSYYLTFGSADYPASGFPTDFELEYQLEMDVIAR